MKFRGYVLLLSILGHNLVASSDSVGEENEHQQYLDSINEQWKKICDAGCQPGTHPDDARFVSDTVIGELISLQYKPNCTAATLHREYYEEIFACSGKRDLCNDLDYETTKCRTKVATRFKHKFSKTDESELLCERDDAWQEDYYSTALGMMRHFYENLCLGGGDTRECYLKVRLTALMTFRI